MFLRSRTRDLHSIEEEATLLEVEVGLNVQVATYSKFLTFTKNVAFVNTRPHSLWSKANKRSIMSVVNMPPTTYCRFKMA